jgi:hypothetical protein
MDTLSDSQRAGRRRRQSRGRLRRVSSCGAGLVLSLVVGACAVAPDTNRPRSTCDKVGEPVLRELSHNLVSSQLRIGRLAASKNREPELENLYFISAEIIDDTGRAPVQVATWQTDAINTVYYGPCSGLVCPQLAIIFSVNDTAKRLSKFRHSSDVWIYATMETDGARRSQECATRMAAKS